MPTVPARFDLEPRYAGAVKLAAGRTIGYSEYGDATGRPVIWFHGTPGGSRQFPLGARKISYDLGVRVILIERPGVGRSTPHLHANIGAFAADVAEVADRLGADRFAVAGLSGGGPYALACAAKLTDRVPAAAILGGVAPARGFEAAPGGLVSISVKVARLLEAIRVPAGHALWGLLRAARPIGPLAIRAYARFSPEGDRRVFERPDMQAMFLDDLIRAGDRQFHAVPADIVLFTREWGFRLSDIAVPVRFWHGNADNIVPLHHAEHMASLVPDSQLTVRDGESHLGSLDAAQEIIETLLHLWERHE